MNNQLYDKEIFSIVHDNLVERFGKDKGERVYSMLIGFNKEQEGYLNAPCPSYAPEKILAPRLIDSLLGNNEIVFKNNVIRKGDDKDSISRKISSALDYQGVENPHNPFLPKAGELSNLILFQELRDFFESNRDTFSRKRFVSIVLNQFPLEDQKFLKDNFFDPFLKEETFRDKCKDFLRRTLHLFTRK